MSEGGDYTESSSYDSSHNFADARRAYDRHAGRSYDEAVSSGKQMHDLLPLWIETDAEKLLFVVCDNTGSMGETPAVVVSKMPYLQHEAKTEYLGPDVEIGAGAFGDAHNNETYPAQARPTAKGKDVKKRFDELVMEGQGGGTKHEDSELVALYYARRVKMPNAKNPVLVLITDEMPYDHVTRSMAASVHVDLKESISTRDIFEELKAKFSVYLILQPYDSGGESSTNAEVRRTWLKYIDEDHIATMPDPSRVVDIIFGILAQEADRVDYFHEEIEGRQTPAQVATVYKSLETIHAAALASGTKSRRKLAPAGKSTMFRTGGGKKSGDLI